MGRGPLMKPGLQNFPSAAPSMDPISGKQVPAFSKGPTFETPVFLKRDPSFGMVPFSDGTPISVEGPALTPVTFLVGGNDLSLTSIQYIVSYLA